MNIETESSDLGYKNRTNTNIYFGASKHETSQVFRM